MKDRPERWLRVSNPLLWAVLASILFSSLLTYLGSVPTCNLDLFPNTGDCPPKWRHVQVATVNEVGDTLAGIAGVFAFIWLVATVLLQAHELKEQRKEFREQRKATEDMARALAAQTDLMSQQTKFLSEDYAAGLASKSGAEALYHFEKAIKEARVLMIGQIELYFDELKETMVLNADDFYPRKMSSGRAIESMSHSDVLETFSNLCLHVGEKTREHRVFETPTKIFDIVQSLKIAFSNYQNSNLDIKAKLESHGFIKFWPKIGASVGFSS